MRRLAAGASLRRARPRGIGRSLAPALAFIALCWFAGGTPGAIVGSLLVVARWIGAPKGFFWALAVVAILVAAAATVMQGLPAGSVTPSYGSQHWVAHAAAGCAIASLTLAALLDVRRIRSAVGRGSAPGSAATDA